MVEARGLFQQGVWGAGSSAKVHNLWQAWGQMEAKEGNIEDARKYLARAVDAADRPATALLAWAMVEERQGGIATSAQVSVPLPQSTSSPSLGSCLPPCASCLVRASCARGAAHVCVCVCVDLVLVELGCMRGACTLLMLHVWCSIAQLGRMPQLTCCTYAAANGEGRDG